MNTKTNYQVGDFLIRLKNAAMAKNKEVKVSLSKKTLSLAEALKKIGYVEEIKKEKDILSVTLMFKNKKPLLQDVKLVSKPGLRVYRSAAELEEKKSPSTYIVSTSKGMIDKKQAIKLRIGGEVIVEIW